MTEPVAAVTASRRVEVYGTIIRANGRVEEIGLLAGTNEDGTPMTPTPRPTGVEHRAAVAFVAELLRRSNGLMIEHLAQSIVDDLFRYGPIVPDDTPGARTHLPPQEGA